LAVPQATVPITVTVAEPALLPSALLVAVITYVPGVADVNVAVAPFGVSVPPAGDTLQVTAPEQEALAVTVAVSVVFAFVASELGLALTTTPLTVHGFGFGLGLGLPPPEPSPPPPQLDRNTAAARADTKSVAIFDMSQPPSPDWLGLAADPVEPD
jgi:hypothetical protein